MWWIVVASVLWFLSCTAHAADTRCAGEKALRSRNSASPTEITFINDTGATVRLYWINFEGRRQLYAQIPAAQRVLQPTFVTHPWIVVDSDGRCLGIYHPARGPSTVNISGDRTQRVAESLISSASASEYKVVGVAVDDTLSLRSEPDPDAEIRQQIPHDATGIVGTGRTETVGSETWIEVIVDKQKGWANSRYLVRLPLPIQATGPKSPSSSSPGSPSRPSATPMAVRGDLSTVDQIITFNVLDHVEYEPQTSKIILMGHRDASYATSGIPYLQYLATLLEYPRPQFSLEWTRDSELRVAELRRRLNSDDEWRRLAGEWGRWIDESEHVTPSGRYFMPLFGIEVPAAGQKMDRYQVLSGVFRAIGEQQASEILAAFGSFYRAMPNPGIPQLYRLFRAAGVYELFVSERSEFQAGRMTEYQVHVDVYRSMFRSFDQALNYSGQPTSTLFENMLRRGQTPDAAMGAALGEFDRQFKGVYGDALRRLYRSKPEFQIPVSLVNPSLRDTLNVEPRFISINSSTLLAKLLLDADVAAKKLFNAPELADKIPEYQTAVTYRLSRPGSKLSGHFLTSRLWISPEQIDALRSSDDNILVFRQAKMRINIREQAQDGRDLPNQRPGEYEALLTSLYDRFARHYSPVFHELREAAKLAYVAEWLKPRNPAYNLQAAGLTNWRAPTSVQGVIFISWSADPSRPDVQTVSAVGGVSLGVPPPGSGVCVKFCIDQIPKDSRIRSVSSLSARVVTDLMSSTTQAAQSFGAVVGIYLSKLDDPFVAYASAELPQARPSGPRVDQQSLPKEDVTRCLQYGGVEKNGPFWVLPVRNHCFSTAITAFTCSYPDGGQGPATRVGSGLLEAAAVYLPSESVSPSPVPSIRLQNGVAAAVFPTEGKITGSAVMNRPDYAGAPILRSPNTRVVEVSKGRFQEFALDIVTSVTPVDPHLPDCPQAPLPLCSENEACRGALEQGTRQGPTADQFWSKLLENTCMDFVGAGGDVRRSGWYNYLREHVRFNIKEDPMSAPAFPGAKDWGIHVESGELSITPGLWATINPALAPKAGTVVNSRDVNTFELGKALYFHAPIELQRKILEFQAKNAQWLWQMKTTPSNGAKADTEVLGDLANPEDVFGIAFRAYVCNLPGKDAGQQIVSEFISNLH